MTATDLRMLMNTANIPAQRIQIPALPRLKPDLDLSDSSLVAVYCFVKNYIGASGTSAVAIDNKIEQAMDLVKSHLMFAVREEVEVLKEKIAELMERISQLEVENNLLRAHAPPDVVASLPQQPPGAVPQYPPNGSVS